MPTTPSDRPATDSGQPPAAPQAQAALIDELMAQPIKARPRITVIGDDAVSGINPPPPPKAAP